MSEKKKCDVNVALVFDNFVISIGVRTEVDESGEADTETCADLALEKLDLDGVNVSHLQLIGVITEIAKTEEDN